MRYGKYRYKAAAKNGFQEVTSTYSMPLVKLPNRSWSGLTRRLQAAGGILLCLTHPSTSSGHWTDWRDHGLPTVMTEAQRGSGCASVLPGRKVEGQCGTDPKASGLEDEIEDNLRMKRKMLEANNNSNNNNNKPFKIIR
ncbi:uncharacterized protein LOC109496468 isoform X1 [Prionailurus iriomotensis]